MLEKFGSFFLDIVQVLIFAISIFLFVYLLVLQPHKIKGSSMEPNFLDGEFLLTDKLSYRFGEPQRGDVIVFRAPPDDSQEFIKRIIGLPGDQIKVQENHIFINGEQLDESSYLDQSVTTSSGSIAQEGKTLTVPDNQYFLMGDNRPHSYDSRNFGFIDQSKFIGKAWLLYWPPQNAGLVRHIGYSF